MATPAPGDVSMVASVVARHGSPALDWCVWMEIHRKKVPGVVDRSAKFSVRLSVGHCPHGRLFLLFFVPLPVTISPNHTAVKYVEPETVVSPQVAVVGNH